MIWLTTDTHFEDEKMIRKQYREEGYEQILMNYFLQIPKEDTLIHLGDICRESENSEYIHKKYIQPINCQKVLIRGNHDHYNKRWYTQNGWDQVYDELCIPTLEGIIKLSHAPQFVPAYIKFNIHGHFHNRPIEKYFDNYSTILCDKHILLAVEHTEYKPVSLQEILQKHKRKDLTLVNF